MDTNQLEERTVSVAKSVFNQFGLVFCKENTNLTLEKDYDMHTCTLIVYGEISPKSTQIMDELEKRFLYAFLEITVEIARYGNEKICITVSNRRSA